MIFLVVFKRFEIWLLLAVVAALVVFAFRPDPAAEFASAAEAPAALVETAGAAPRPEDTPGRTTTDETLRVGEVRVVASEGGTIVETVLAGRSPTGADLVLDGVAVSAATEAGEPVPRFFEPFREPETLSAEGDSLASVRWWLATPEKAIWVAVGELRLRADLP